MGLDELYKTVKFAMYPIYDREQLEKYLGKIRIEFEKDYYDARDISTMITDYPIKNASHVIELFIKAAAEEYEDEATAREFAKDMG
jgi:hypothetical protein